MESQGALAQSLKIGQVANRSGLTVKSIRFYSDEGLIKPISRSDGGYRLFDDKAGAGSTGRRRVYWLLPARNRQGVQSCVAE